MPSGWFEFVAIAETLAQGFGGVGEGGQRVMQDRERTYEQHEGTCKLFSKKGVDGKKPHFSPIKSKARLSLGVSGENCEDGRHS